MKRNAIIITIIISVLAVGLLTVTLVLRKPNNTNDNNLNEVTTVSENDILASNIVSTALQKDDIPPLENPIYVTVEKAHFLEDNDKVFILETDIEVFIYPRKIMVWHEIVNETINGESVSITYCPLTGSVIGYEGNIGEHDANTYGTSGKLLNSNLVMYDRATDSFIPQIHGKAINSDLEGLELNTLPVYWANWSDAKATYPNAKVLTLETGFQRDYFLDPYGTYSLDASDSYYTSGEPMFNVMNPNDGTFPNKKVITGVKYQDNRIAIDPMLIKANNVVSFNIGDTSAVAFYDNNLNTVRVYRVSSEESLEFKYEDGRIIDNMDIVWTIMGTSENGKQLEHITHFDVMWFAWYAYYPETNVLK